MNTILDRFVGNISPVALLVSSFFWSWFDIVPFSPALFSAAGAPFRLEPLAVSLAMSAVVLALLAVSKSLRERALGAKAFMLCSLVCGAGGTVVIWMGVLTSSTVLLVVGGILIGVYEGVGAETMGGIATCQGTTNALIHLAAALPLNLVAVLLVMFLQPEASVVFAALLPLLSALCFWVFTVRGHNLATLKSTLVARMPRTSQTKSARRLIGRDPQFLLVVLVATTAFGLVNVQAMTSVEVGSSVAYVSLVIRAVASAVVFIGYLCFSWRPYSIMGVSLVFMAVGLVASGVAETSVGSWLFLAGYLCFDVLIWALIIMLNYRSGMPLLRTICIVYALDQLGIFVGTLTNQFMPSGRTSDVVFIVLGSALMLLMVWMANGKSSVKDNLSIYELEFDAQRAVEKGEAPSDDLFTLPTLREGRIAEMTARYFLSAREADILALLVAGRNGPYIAEHFCVSDNTVKTHIRHIYTKLDVHNRQELLDLVLSPES